MFCKGFFAVRYAALPAARRSKFGENPLTSEKMWRNSSASVYESSIRALFLKSSRKKTENSVGLYWQNDYICYSNNYE